MRLLNDTTDIGEGKMSLRLQHFKLGILYENGKRQLGNGKRCAFLPITGRGVHGDEKAVAGR